MTTDLSDLTLLIANPWVDRYAEFVSSRFPQLNIIKSKLLNEEKERISDDVSEVDIILSFTPLIRSQPKMKRLKWFQSLAAGYDHIIGSGRLSKDVILTNAAGVAGIGISEFTIAMMLAFAKKFPMLIDKQYKREWGFWCSEELNGKTLGILGLGNLGRPLAKAAKLGFDMNVIAYDRFVTEYEYADKVSSDLKEILPASDFLTITLPLNDDTRGLLGEKEFRMMKSNLFFINMGRGDIVIKDALLRALREKWIAGAGLDVFWGSEPSEMVLGPNDELWGFENVMISPHTAWFSENYADRASDLFCRNLERFLQGEPMINQVDW